LPKVEVHDTLSVDVRRAYEVTREGYRSGKFGGTSNIRSVTVLEEGEDYSVTEWDVVLQGKAIKWSERDTYDDERMTIEFDQVKGDLAKMSGACVFTEVPGGTLVTLWVEFDFGIPMLSTLLNPIAVVALRKNLMEMLDRIKSWLREG
jgi:uncharacterized membrane protein